MEARIDSRVEHVTVYRRGARVTRAALVTPLDGALPEQVLLGNLPLTLDDASLSVRVAPRTGEGRAPRAERVRVTLDIGARDESLAPPDDEELLRARLELEKLRSAYQHRQHEIAQLGVLSVGPRRWPRDAEPNPIPLEPRLRLIELRERRAEHLTQQAAALWTQLMQAQKRYDDLYARDQRASSNRQLRDDELCKLIYVGFDTAGADVQEFDLFFEYLVSGARWAPAYSLSLNSGGPARLLLRGLVKQRSGEDWNSTRLTLSTADPQRHAGLPELKSLRVGRAQPAPKPGWRKPPPGADLLYTDYDGARAQAYAPERSTLDLSHEIPEVGGGVVMLEPAQPAQKQKGQPAARLAYAAPQPPARSPTPVAAAAEDTQSNRYDEMARSLLAESAPPAGFALAAAAPGAMAPAQSMEPPKGMGARMAPPAARGRSMFGGLLEGASDLPSSEAAADAPARIVVAAPAPLEPDRDLLDYGGLRMVGPDAAERGRLRRISRELCYQELVRVDVTRQLAVREDVWVNARARSERCEAEPAPTGHFYPDDDLAYDGAYPADHPVDVPSDGEFHSLSLSECTLDVHDRYVSVPRETQHVFRTVEFENPLPYAMLAGPVDVYSGSDYLLSASVASTPRAGKVEIGLGVEQRVKIARNVQFAEEAAGLLRGQLELHHRIVIDVQNNGPAVADIEVRERVPVVREGDDDVRVVIDAVSPAWKPYEQREPLLHGGYAWRVAIPANGSAQLEARYTIRLPAKHELVGGNRRDS